LLRLCENKNLLCQIIGLAAAGSACYVPTPVVTDG